VSSERVIRFGPGALARLPDVCHVLGVERPLLVTTRRGAAGAADLPVVGIFDGVRPHVPVATVLACTEVVLGLAADGLVGLGGGSAIDTCKAVAAELAARLGEPPRIVAVPTTYAGAEWTPFYGMLLEPGRKGGGADDRVRPAAAIYDPLLTLELPPGETVGTALNALAHCAEAYYHPAAEPRAAREADVGAAAIGEALPAVVEEPAALDARSLLLQGALHAALALEASGVCLAHAMAQGLGGRFGLPQGAMNALCLPPALRFNAEVVPAAVARLGTALGTADAPARCEELARLGGFECLRRFGIDEQALAAVAAQIAARPGAQANPRPVTPPDVERLLREIW
jgi:maleylacetate reductase